MQKLGLDLPEFVFYGALLLVGKLQPLTARYIDCLTEAGERVERDEDGKISFVEETVIG